jgi:hypothetical protein
LTATNNQPLYPTTNEDPDMGGIIPEGCARSSRNRWAASSESAVWAVAIAVAVRKRGAKGLLLGFVTAPVVGVAWCAAVLLGVALVCAIKGTCI